MSGYVGMTGFQDTPPVLPPVPLADEVAGVFGAMAGMMAIYHRDSAGSGKGQVVDLSLFEPLFRLCIPHVTMFDLLGINRERVGNDFPDAAPRSLYRTGDEHWLGLSATSQRTFENLANAMGMPELIERPAFKDNAARLQNVQELNLELDGWLGQRTLQQVMEQLVPAGGVVGPVYDAAQIVGDPHYQAREDIIEIDDPELGHYADGGSGPQVSAILRVPWNTLAPPVGEHNPLIYGAWLGLGEEDLKSMAERGTI